MRFLCLHGAGTNAEIFEIQSGGISYDLAKKGHTFKYYNGCMEAEVEPQLKGLFPGPFYNHYPRDQVPGENLAIAMKHVYQIIEREGPFDAVMGFSQGAGLACAMIAHHAKTHQEPLFKLAVFICGALPYDSTGSEVLAVPPPGGDYPVQIHTTNIVGKQDELYPSSMHLYGVCDPAKARFYDHGSRHLVPFDVENTEAMVAAIDASIQRALTGQ
ncbi:hypothetical protein BO78DRAFT_432081 [Aspergillus sclerotiicarbonarius CBS 121057]|uniref:Serine hydrolase domain-containing protein n=1 Tax=Aspergillus sclerotiicarbonarius (strain CBS 121057 / IBT 28362) TaxID=1448318 RepID=A0A319E5E2_ASPSB|nr:hypothetical protein BO78DRAFT_432081 [Aspergillus sclerotiicarbonarius CBS 121057]